MNNKQREYLYASIEDNIMKADRRLIPVYTNFFNLVEQKNIENFLINYDSIRYLKLGGHKYAERCLFCIYSIFIEYDIDYYVPPIKVLTISWDERYYSIGHRDVLGAILGLGIKRDIVGDIIIDGSVANVFVVENISEFIVKHLIKIGSASVEVRCHNTDEIKVKGPDIKIIKAVIPSKRLDCIVSAGFGISRTKSVNIIKSGRVMVNWEVHTKPSYVIESGDMITIRGMGRIRYKDVMRRTKKDRLLVKIERYI
ncbi:MAG TPA: hypothetical protein GX392_02325 [Clostridiales bacterium]|nr:hypothetical protein [Clostridiales bacterium]